MSDGRRKKSKTNFFRYKASLTKNRLAELLRLQGCDKCPVHGNGCYLFKEEETVNCLDKIRVWFDTPIVPVGEQ